MYAHELYLRLAWTPYYGRQFGTTWLKCQPPTNPSQLQRLNLPMSTEELVLLGGGRRLSSQLTTSRKPGKLTELAWWGSESYWHRDRQKNCSEGKVKLNFLRLEIRTRQVQSSQPFSHIKTIIPHFTLEIGFVMCVGAKENQAHRCDPYGLRVQEQPLFLVCSSNPGADQKLRLFLNP